MKVRLRTNNNFDFGQWRKDNKKLITKWTKEFQKMEYGRLLKKHEIHNRIRYHDNLRLFLLGCERRQLDNTDCSNYFIKK